MDTRRLVLLVIFVFSLFMIWQGWEKHQHPAAANVTGPAAPATANAPAGGNAVPAPSTSLSAANVPAPSASSVPTPAAAAVSGPKVHVSTDMFEADIAAQGGDLIKVELVKHKATGDVSRNFVLLDGAGPHHYAAQSGLIGEGLPNHKTVFSLPGDKLSLKDGEKDLSVRLEAPAVNGVKVTKVYTFHRGSYLIDVGYEVANQSQAAVQAFAYFQLVRDGTSAEEDSRMAQTFTGAAIYTDADKYQKVEFADIEKGKAKFSHKSKDGWVALVQHYFVAGWLPKGDSEREFILQKAADNLYSTGLILPVAAVAAGKSGSISVPLYVGPQEQDKLKAAAPEFDLVVDYGWLKVIAAPLFWVLEFINNLVGNWGWAIIILTILLKLAFFPLSAASYKSMAKMRVVGPRMQKLKEQFGHDKQRLNQEMMDLYRKEKINPLGGCLPILIQIPVFIALYWTLMGTVEMRHAPWMFWITDLSVKDPYYVLPLIMGATMLIQTKLNPAPPDPVQAKIMLAMPIIFTGMFLFFPSGLVLYWVVNNVLSIAQQWQITRMMESGGEAKPAK